jgi:hypothetical protein
MKKFKEDLKVDYSNQINSEIKFLLDHHSIANMKVLKQKLTLLDMTSILDQNKTINDNLEGTVIIVA